MLIFLIGLVAIAVALARGGKLTRWADLTLRWRGVVILGFLIQVLIFSRDWQSQAMLKPWTPYLYITSMSLILIALLANFHLPGIRLITLGLCLNLLAIIFNGGYMPASADALTLSGHALQTTNNSIVMTSETRLTLLGDIFAIPKGLPFANVFSVGDVCLVIGAVYLIQKTLVAPKAMQ